MRIYLALLVLVLGFAFIIARHDEYAALNSTHKASYQNNATSTAKPNEQHPEEHPKYSYWDSPSGHIFHDAFSWSGGTTIWAIILTLLAIADQTRQVAKAAKATSDQAVQMKRQIDISINKESARIFVAYVNNDYSFLMEGKQRRKDSTGGLDPTVDRFYIAITNQGESKAYGVAVSCNVTVTKDERNLLKHQREESVGVLNADTKPTRLGIEIWEGIDEPTLNAIRDKTAKLRFYGRVSYENAFEPGKRIEVPFGWIWVVEHEWTDVEELREHGVWGDQSHWEEES